eukprot:CAMPEP_0167801180 /NCGR_PEP_ID=MMETSP0111_2-20121227/18247_1 /TAXON_ID=91324 /ORGANISM="Lotharella globosa, Strain CCCM811" /LENGTH=81 /DNA_ID=CAMNT_0007696729 /DNA_START=39 /DNA_END=281 /DNA_ORIENTATION=+
MPGKSGEPRRSVSSSVRSMGKQELAMVALGILGIFALLQQSGFTSGARSARENDQMGKLVRQVQKLSEVFNEDISRLREEL